MKFEHAALGLLALGAVAWFFVNKMNAPADVISNGLVSTGGFSGSSSGGWSSQGGGGFSGDSSGGGGFR